MLLQLLLGDLVVLLLIIHGTDIIDVGHLETVVAEIIAAACF